MKTCGSSERVSGGANAEVSSSTDRENTAATLRGGCQDCQNAERGYWPVYKKSCPQCEARMLEAMREAGLYKK